MVFRVSRADFAAIRSTTFKIDTTKNFIFIKQFFSNDMFLHNNPLRARVQTSATISPFPTFSSSKWRKNTIEHIKFITTTTITVSHQIHMIPPPNYQLRKQLSWSVFLLIHNCNRFLSCKFIDYMLLQFMEVSKLKLNCTKYNLCFLELHSGLFHMRSHLSV
jgi:hypothetical protein